MFINDDFLLDTPQARTLFHEYAEGQPIIDYHSHLDPAAIADNRQFSNIAQLWLDGDHYKWRAMRTNGIPERLCSGDAPDREKGGYGAAPAAQSAVPLDASGTAPPLRHFRHSVQSGNGG